jgi:glycosyltransferase involved in cell wall biosynthesis
VSVARAARRDRTDVLHYLYAVRPVVSPGCPVIITIHDAIAQALPSYRLSWYLEHVLQRNARSADHVITGSESARQDLIRYLELPPEKVSAVLLGTPRMPETPAANGPGGDPYWLFVGGTEERKNLGAVLHAFAADELADTRLKVVGGTASSPRHLDPNSLLEPVPAGARERIDWLGEVGDGELDALYRGALALVFPSFYEGFGLPVIEAMSRSTPVITSDVSSLPEVAGDGAILINPHDPEALRDAMERLAHEPDVRARLVERGRAVAERLSSQQSARAALAVYERVAAA